MNKQHEQDSLAIKAGTIQSNIRKFYLLSQVLSLRCISTYSMIHEILKQYRNHNSFRLLQEDIIHAVLAGRDTLALLPNVLQYAGKRP